jgi:predicted DNA-binding protein (MmcQ/YjbR family)
MTLKEYKAYCNKMKGVEETYPFGDQTVVFKVGGKMFSLTNVTEFKMGGELKAAFHHLSVKCDPDMGADLRRNFEDIIPGWHLSKTHWISLLMGGKLKDSLIKDLIDQSYDLIISSLPKKEQTKLK